MQRALIIAWALVLAGCATPPPPGAQSAPPVAPDVPVTGEVQVVHDETMPPAWDWSPRVREGNLTYGCPLGESYELRVERVESSFAWRGDVIDRATKDSVAGLDPGVSSRFFKFNLTPYSVYACNTWHGVAFLFQPAAGRLDAFDTAGINLWSLVVPNVRWVEGATEISDADKAGLLRAVWDTGEAAIGVQIEASASFELVVWRHGRQFSMACIDSGGRLRGTLGPVPFGVVLKEPEQDRFVVGVGTDATDAIVDRVLTVSCGAPPEVAP